MKNKPLTNQELETYLNKLLQTIDLNCQTYIHKYVAATAAPELKIDDEPIPELIKEPTPSPDSELEIESESESENDLLRSEEHTSELQSH